MGVMHLVPHVCRSHGVVVHASPTALVYCGRCDETCAPEGVSPQAHRRAYLERRRARFAMRRLRNRARQKPLSQANLDPNEARKNRGAV
jgi:hypothetical protein